MSTTEEQVEQGSAREAFPDVVHCGLIALDDTERAVVRVTLGDAITTLNEPYQNVLTSYYREGLSCGEIADRTDITRDNVKTRLNRARRKLHEILGDSHCDYSE